ncbi:Protein of unknown function DUF3464 [Macleaya cordata]|uniref:Protein PAM68 n=1 Tax=Macleaya cordata TaxID=56857 RepID=A0A200R6S1_MACCD|nr:Protein of unknown function DUF3464 [Macleaya cordata]
MESCPFSRTPPSTSYSSFSLKNKSISHRLITQKPFSNSQPSFLPTNLHLSAALKSGPRGFGPSPKKRKKKNIEIKKPKRFNKEDDEEEEDETEDGGVIPEIVTNRMMSRMGFSVGIPLFIGLMFFPFFYYLKVGLKIDVPTWVPFIVSFIFFGSALLGVSYGIVSSSWDPMREGSLLGWNEAKKNWPVFWQSLRGRSTMK